MIVLGLFSLFVAVMITRPFSFGIWEIDFKNFKEIATAIVTAPVLLLVWWLRVVHHEETLAAQQKTNEIAETTAKTAQIVANKEKEFKIYERRYAELNDIKASLEALAPLTFDETALRLHNPNAHEIQNAAIFALARLTDFLQEGEAHLQPIRRAAFILLKQTWASYVRESCGQIQIYAKDFETDCTMTNYSIDYRSDSIIQQLTKALLRGLKSKENDGRYFKAELSLPIFKDELNDLWLIGMDTLLVPDVCFYVEDVDFKEANFSFSRLNNIHFERVHFSDVICDNTIFSSGKIFFKTIYYQGFNSGCTIQCWGNINFVNMVIDTDKGGDFSFKWGQWHRKFQVRFFESIVTNTVIQTWLTPHNNKLIVEKCVFKRATLQIEQKIKVANSYFIDIDQKQGSLIKVDQKDDADLQDIAYYLNFDNENHDDFFHMNNIEQRVGGIGGTFQFANKEDQERILSITDWNTLIKEINACVVVK
ncbi:MAG: pentapeptide repeat-containing protein [Neisseriaceae bacterium]|nr:pentapeptide repeat-containing protein [Neisseriaceae bacterium]